MISDKEIRAAGVKAPVDALGEVEAERFIALVQREPFDYTQWQRGLWLDKSLEEVDAAAAQLRSQKR